MPDSVKSLPTHVSSVTNENPSNIAVELPSPLGSGPCHNVEQQARFHELGDGGTYSIDGLDEKIVNISELPEVDHSVRAPELRPNRSSIDLPERPERAIGLQQRQHRDGKLRRVCIAGIAIALIVCAVALGAGLGAGLTRKHSASSHDPPPSSDGTATGGGHGSTTAAPTPSATPPPPPLKVLSGTGLASTLQANGTEVLLYYQLPAEAGSYLVEDLYTADALSQSNMLANQTRYTKRTKLNAAGIVAGSPIAVTSFMYDDVSWRCLYYVNTQAQIMAMNISSYMSAWRDPAVITTGNHATGSPALAACYEPGIGVMLYFGDAGSGGISQLFSISDVGMTGAWTSYLAFPYSANGGVACTGVNTVHAEAAQDVYMRNSSSAAYVHLNLRNNSLYLVPDSQLEDPSASVKENTGIAAVPLNAGQYLFWIGGDGNIMQNWMSGADDQSQAAFQWRSTIPGWAITAFDLANDNSGPTVAYENPAGQINFDVVNTNGGQVATVPVLSD